MFLREETVLPSNVPETWVGKSMKNSMPLFTNNYEPNRLLFFRTFKFLS
jgi:hypothetical protein